MAGEGFRKRKIRTLGKVVTGKTPPTADPENFGGPYPFITIPDLDGRVFIDSTERTISEQGAEILKACKLPAGAVMMSCIATIGKCGITTRPSFTNQQINSVICEEYVDPRYLYYCFTRLEYALEAAGGGGSVYTNVSKSRFAEIEIELPSIFEQRAIACILGALDDKIELNRRMNETLEQIAQAIFKKWFIEPTKKGKLPEGWKVSKLGDIADVNWGDTNVTKKSYVDYGFLAFSAKGPDGFLPYYDYNRVGVVVSAIGANSGYTWLARGKWSCIKNTIRFWAIAPDISTEYLYFITHGNHIWPIRGSAQPFISQTDARNLPILHPADALAKQFGEIVAPMFEKMYFNDQQSRTLAALRDTLLPKLISGELRVPDSEKICARGASALGGMERCL